MMMNERNDKIECEWRKKEYGCAIRQRETVEEALSMIDTYACV